MISRDEFSEIYQKYDPECKVLDHVTACETLITRNYLFFYDFEYMELSIFRKNTLDYNIQMVNWYKPYHLGRALNVVGMETYEEVDEFMRAALSQALEKIEEIEV